MADKTSALQTLHSRLVDSRDGFENAMGDVKDGDMGAFLRRCLEDRNAFHDRLHAALDAEGIDVRESGTASASAHRTLMDIRGALSSSGEGVYAEVARGETYLKSAYDDAVEATSGANAYDFLVEQRAKVDAAIKEAEALAK